MKYDIGLCSGKLLEVLQDTHFSITCSFFFFRSEKWTVLDQKSCLLSRDEDLGQAQCRFHAILDCWKNLDSVSLIGTLPEFCHNFFVPTIATLWQRTLGHQYDRCSALEIGVWVTGCRGDARIWDRGRLDLGLIWSVIVYCNRVRLFECVLWGCN